MQSKKSFVMFLSSMIIYGSIGLFRRYIPLPSAVLACCRGFLGTLFLLCVVFLQKRPLKHAIGKRKVLGLMITGVLMGLNWILLFEAYNQTTVATATLCYYMQPIIVVILSPLCFHEQMTARKGLCILIAFIGMVLVSGVIETGMPQLSELQGILLGLGAAVLYALVVIINKKLPGIDAYEKTIIQLLSAAVILLPYILVTRQGVTQALTIRTLLMLLIVGFVHTGLAYLLYFGSMEGLKAQTIAIFSYLDPLTALVLSAVILKERLSLFGMIGAIFIIGAALMSDKDIFFRYNKND